MAVINIGTSGGGGGERLSGRGTGEGSINLNPIAQGLASVGQGLQQYEAKNEEVRRKKQLAEDTTYVSKASIDSTIASTDLRKQMEKEYADRPSEFAKAYQIKSQELYQEYIDNAPSDTAKRSLTNQMTGTMVNQFKNAVSWGNKQEISGYLASHEDGITKLSNMSFQDPSGFSNAMALHEDMLASATTYLDPSEVEKLRSKGEKAISNAVIEGAMKKSPEAAEKFLDSGRFDEILGSKEQSRLRDQIKRQKAHRELQHKQRRAEQREAVLNTLAVKMHKANSIDNINDVSSEVEELFSAGAISGKEYVSFLNQVDSQSESIIERATDNEMVFDSFSSGIPLDSSHKDSVRAANSYYEDILEPQLSGLSGEEKSDKITEYVQATGIIPNKIRRKMHGALASGTESQQIAASQQLMKITEENPQFIRQLDDELFKKATQIKSLEDSGLSATEIGLAVKGNAFQKGSEEYSLIRQNFKDNRVDFDPSEFNQFFRDDPEQIPTAMQEDWETTYRDLYVTKNMDEESARKGAYKLVESKWGVSGVGGSPRWVKDSPELVYGKKGVSDDWIAEDLFNTVKDNNFLNSLGATIDKKKSNLRLVRDTTRKGKDTMYNVIYEDDDGVMHMVPSSNNSAKPLVWQPSYEDTPQFKENKKKKEENVKRLKETVKTRRSKYNKIQSGVKEGSENIPLTINALNP